MCDNLEVWCVVFTILTCSVIPSRYYVTLWCNATMCSKNCMRASKASFNNITIQHHLLSPNYVCNMCVWVLKIYSLCIMCDHIYVRCLVVTFGIVVKRHHETHNSSILLWSYAKISCVKAIACSLATSTCQVMAWTWLQLFWAGVALSMLSYMARTTIPT